MSGSRQLSDVLRSWQSCEEICGDLNHKLTQPRDAHLAQHADHLEHGEAALARTIENQIIPRLMLAHRLSASRNPDFANRGVSDADVSELARLVLQHDTSVSLTYLQTLLEQGASIDAVFLELLAPTARRLGEMWNADLCDFTDVTIGLSRLQQLCHELSPDFETEEVKSFDDHRILLATVPGEQHTLGIMLVEEYFRRAGWECCSISPQSVKELVKVVKRQHFDVVGFSVSYGILLEGVASAIQAVRKASLNKSVAIMVGGPIFLEHPEYAARVGADGTAEDGRQAVIQLRSLLGGKAKTIR